MHLDFPWLESGLNYNLFIPLFHGYFTNFWPFNNKKPDKTFIFDPKGHLFGLNKYFFETTVPILQLT